MTHKHKAQETCNCPAYPFPHRWRGGKCDACKHGKDWRGLYEALTLENGEWCPDCAYDEGYRGETPETLSAYERNRGATFIRRTS